MVTRDCTSGYRAWVQMKKENEKVMAYKNIGRRVLILQKEGFLEEIKLDDVKNLHGRKDYKVTNKGMEQLIPFVLTHSEEVENLVKYMDKFDFDKRFFGDILQDRIASMADAANAYREHTGLPIVVATVSKMAGSIAKIFGELSQSDVRNIVVKKAVEIPPSMLSGEQNLDDFLIEVNNTIFDTQHFMTKANELYANIKKKRIKKKTIETMKQMIDDAIKINNQSVKLLSSIKQEIKAGKLASSNS